MKWNFTNLLLIGILGTLITGSVLAQNINQILSSYTGTNASGYLRPVTDLTAASLHTGLWSLMPDDSSFHVRFGLTHSAFLPFSNQQEFEAVTEYPFTPESKVLAPTIVGAIESVTVQGENGTAFVFPGGFKPEVFLYALPEIAVGEVAGTSLYGRYLGFRLNDDEFDRFSNWGLGIQHDISRYFPHEGYRLGIGYAYHQVKLGDQVNGQFHLISGNAYLTGRLGLGYVSLGYAISNMQVSYDYDSGETTERIRIDTKGDYPFMAEIGGELNLWVIRLRLAAKVSPPFGAAAGLHFAF